jgi:putative membrane protein
MIKHLFIEVSFTEALRKVLFLSVLIGLYGFIIYYFFPHLSTHVSASVGAFQQIFGIILGLLLVFRSNRAYERWWEARGFWGDLLNISRNLAIKTKLIIKPDNTQSKEIAGLVIKFSQALAIHLKQTPSYDALSDLVGEKKLPPHVPSFLMDKLYQTIFKMRADLTDADKWLLDRELREFMVVCGGSEKIKSTLVSISFRILMKHVIVVFVLMMPVSMNDVIGVYAIPVTIIITYFILALEGIARNLEKPFGVTEDHINLCEINENLSLSVNQILSSE